MTAFQTQKAADEATLELAWKVVRQLRRKRGSIVETPYDNGTLPEYGGGYCFSAEIDGENYHIEIIGPYVEGDEDA